MLLFCGEIEVYPTDNRLLNFYPFISLKVYGSEMRSRQFRQYQILAIVVGLISFGLLSLFTPLNAYVLWLLALSLVTFLLYVFLAKRFAWLPLIEGLDARESRVNRALAGAEQARVEAEKLLSDHRTRMSAVTEEVRGIVAAARAAAEKEKARIIAEADREAAALRDGALAEIESARQAAMADLDAQVDGQANATIDHLMKSRF